MRTPYTIKAILAILLFCASIHTDAAWSFTQTAITTNNGGANTSRAGGFNPQVLPIFNNAYLSSYNSASSFRLVGGYVRTQQTSPSNICNAIMYYRIYRTCDAAPVWISVPLSTITDLGAGAKEWSNQTLNLNILNGLTPATYWLEVRWSLIGSAGCANCCTETLYDVSATAGYKAQFDYDMTDSFTDGNYTSSPIWSGDLGAYKYSKSTTAAAGATSSNSLVLNVTNSGGSQYISTPISVWSASEQTWSFWLGRKNQAYTNPNNVSIWLYANEANLESTTVDGYRINIGDDTGGDEIRLQCITNGVVTNVITSTGAIPNGLTDIGLSLKIVRLAGGNWQLYTSTLPTSNGLGQTAYTCPESSAIVSQGTGTNNLYVPSGTGYFGLVTIHTSGSNPRKSVEFDALKINSIFNLQTQVKFAQEMATVNETMGSLSVPITILNPALLQATNVTVTRVSGDAARVGGFNSQTITFPAGSSAPKNIDINITNNTICEIDENLVFQITSVTGGNLAVANNPNIFYLTVADDETSKEALTSYDFESGNLSGWTQSTPTAWYVDSAQPINESFSLRNTNTGVSGTAYASTNIGSLNLNASNTIWRFSLNHFEIEPDQNDKFLVFITANESNLYSATVDGYAVGINPTNASSPDLITLWRVDNGVPTASVVVSSIDWGSAHQEIGFEIVRQDNGVWSLKISEFGDFNNLILAGSGTETTYSTADYFGVRVQFKNTTSGMLSFDDGNISASGCRVNYYSQNGGNISSPIWATAPVGPSGFAKSNKYSSYTVQNGHTVTSNANWIMEHLAVNNMGTINLGINELSLHGNLNNSGTIVSGTSTLAMGGKSNQSIISSSDLTLNNLRILNEGFTVNLTDASELFIKGIVSPEKGTFNTNDRLTLLSTASGTASIGEIKPGADVIGKVTIERFIPSLTNYPYGSWVMMGCPVQGATISDWNDDIITSGFVGSDYPAPYPFTNIQRYDETVAGNEGMGYVLTTSLSEPIISDAGYAVYMQTPSQAIDVKGTIYKNSFNKNLSYTNTGNAADGWNLLVNQYPSQIDMQPIILNGVGVASFYVFDAESNNYKVYNANTNTGTTSKFLNSSQAFFVKASAAGNYLRYNESYKANTAAPFERSEAANSYMSFTLSSSNNSTDECIVLFTDQATSNFEWEYDAEELTSPDPNAVGCATLSADNVKLTLDARHYEPQNTSILVYANMPVAGTYTFHVNETVNMPFGSCLYVEDLVTGNTLPLENGEELSVTITEPYQGNRFIIHTSPALNIVTTNASCFNIEDGAIVISGAVDNWNIQLSDGASVMTSIDNYNFHSLPAGEYELMLQPAALGCYATSMALTIEQPANNALEIVSATPDHCNEAGNAVLEWFINNSQEYTYNITNSAGELFANGTSSYQEMLFENMVGDVYTLEINDNCGAQTVEINLNDPSTVTTDIYSEDITIAIENGQSTTVAIEQISTNANAYEWSLDNGFESSDEIFVYDFTTAGNYTLMLLASNENCSAADFIQIEVNGIVGVSDQEPASYVSIVQLPNRLDYTLYQSNGGNLETKIYDGSGKLVWNTSTMASHGQTFSTDISSFAGGFYTAIINLDNKPLATKKFVKQ
jgi:Calx-beta domain